VTQTSPLQIEYVPAASLKPFPGNPRKHPDEVVSKIVRSIEHFGWTNPILLSADGVVVAGHARLKAAQIAGLKEVPVIRLPLKGEEAQLYTIADNKTQELTEWDWPKLGDLFGELDTGALDLELSGFDTNEIKGLMHGLDNATKAAESNTTEASVVVTKCPRCGYEIEAA